MKYFPPTSSGIRVFYLFFNILGEHFVTYGCWKIPRTSIHLVYSSILSIIGYAGVWTLETEWGRLYSQMNGCCCCWSRFQLLECAGRKTRETTARQRPQNPVRYKDWSRVVDYTNHTRLTWLPVRPSIIHRGLRKTILYIRKVVKV